MASTQPARESLGSLFRLFFVLGCTSFGGPIAHLGYFRTEFVERRRWLNDSDYADLIALCQFLPGPASSQVGMGLGFFRRGALGALTAWLGFTLPSAILMIGFALLLSHTQIAGGADWLSGLKIVAVAVVAQALWGMSRNLCPDRNRATLAVVSTLLVFMISGVWGQLAAIALGGIVGYFWLTPDSKAPSGHFPAASPRTGWVLLFVFVGLLLLLPIAASQTDNLYLQLIDSFYRAGALVFGGGHVVLPLLQAELVPEGLVSRDWFLAGYGAAQALPGPLFTFSGFLGAATGSGANAILLGAVALVAIFLPGFLVLFAAFPLWAKARQHPSLRKVMLGINAAVVGLLLAAFYDPVWTSAIGSPADFGLALAAFAALVFWRLPPWLVVLASALLSTVV